MRARIAIAAAGVWLLLTAVGVSVAAAGNFFTQATPLSYGVTATASNVGANTEIGEALTPSAQGVDTCVGPANAWTAQTQATLWWSIVGSGRPITVTTAGSNFDTVLGLSATTQTGVFSCLDNQAANSGETLSFNTTPGHVYFVQVGGCLNSTPQVCGPATGTEAVTATAPPPPNDAPGAASELNTTSVAGDNLAAGEDPGENLSCGGTGFGRTVWYRWTPPNPGHVSLTATGINSIVALYSAGALVACAGGRLDADVAAGTYYVQVGGAGPHAASSSGLFTLLTNFTATPDRDGDGALDAADCAPDNPAIHPGAVDRPHNRIDEDCSGRDAKWPRFNTTITLDGALLSSFARVRSITVSNVSAGTRVEVRCRGRGCPYARRARTHRNRAAAVVEVSDRRLRRARLRVPLVLQVRVTRPGFVGRVRTYSFSRNSRRPKRTTRCINPGSRKSIACSQAG